jgi:predicted Zn-ribbon and HTH transcriptional regulator
MGAVFDPTCDDCGYHWQGDVLGETGGLLVMRCTRCDQSRALPNDDIANASIGPCDCGGRFEFGAPVRCPACRSDRVSLGPPTLELED